MSILGRARLTQDVDALVNLPEAEWAKAISAAAGCGIVPRTENALEFAKRSRVLLLRHEPSAIDIDVILAGLSFEQEAISRHRSTAIGDFNIPLPRVEDLLVMKAIAQRPKDVQDLEALLVTHPETDLPAVRHWLNEFAKATSDSELLERFDSLVSRVRTRRR